MTTSMHIRGGLILWREVLESSSRREGPPRPTRGYSLSRRFGTREIATWTEGLFCEVEADLSSKLERLRIPGLSAIDVLRPFSSTAIPASLQGFLLQVLRPAWGRRAFFYNSFFLVKETVLRPPSVSVLRPTFFRKLITPSWISRYPVGKSRTPMSDVRVSLSRFRLMPYRVIVVLGFHPFEMEWRSI